MLNVRLDGLFTLRSPLSHIGEAISTGSYLAEESVLQPDGTTEPVFAYSGNAWRGQLRDLMAAYMLDKLGRPDLTADAFHLLFSGGRIGGTQTIDLDKARRMRRTVPLIALLGGGIGNQILQGKLRVGVCYPLCREALPVLPRALHEEAAHIAYADCTMVREFSRRDDSKVEAINQYLPAPDQVLLSGDKAPKRGRNDGGTADQMRISSELVVPGVRLRTTIVGTDVSEVELGCLVSGLHRFSTAPHIGGQSSRGHGLVDLDYAMMDLDTGERHDNFVVVDDGACLLAPRAADAKAAYDQHLRSLYDARIAAGASEIAALLGSAA